ncbi:MAG: phosphoglycerate kinase, partial [Patescibacteria group bacterium]
KNNYQLQSIKSIELTNKRVLLRVDFNVPIKNGKVEDAFKIEEVLPTIHYLLKHNCSIVLVSHLGRPKGKQAKVLSLFPVFKILKKKLAGEKLIFESGKFSQILTKKISNRLVKRELIFLENIRFNAREEKNDLSMAKELACLGEVYVNEAFAVSHRKAASIDRVAGLMPSYAGFKFFEEVKYLSKALKPMKPAVALIGGAKVETKFDVIENFLKIYNQVLLGGGLANTFLKAAGYDIGGSLFDADKLRKAKLLLQSKKIILPLDVVVADKKTRQSAFVTLVGNNKKLCSKDEEILDIGPKTIIAFSQLIRQAKTIVWGGPMGLFELPKFSHGTIALAKIIGARSSGRALGIAGGGETLYAIHKSKMAGYYDFISTGGGAMLEFLSGKKLAGIEALKKISKTQNYSLRSSSGQASETSGKRDK